MNKSLLAIVALSALVTSCNSAEPPVTGAEAVTAPSGQLHAQAVICTVIKPSVTTVGLDGPMSRATLDSLGPVLNGYLAETVGMNVAQLNPADTYVSASKTTASVVSGLNCRPIPASSSYELIVGLPNRSDVNIIMTGEFFTGVGADIKFGSSSNVKITRYENIPQYDYQRVTVADAMKRTVTTAVASISAQRIIGLDLDVPYSERAASLSFQTSPLGSLGSPVIGKNGPLTAQSLTSGPALGPNDIDPRCWGALPNGGVAAQTIVVCPNPLPPRPPCLCNTTPPPPPPPTCSVFPNELKLNALGASAAVGFSTGALAAATREQYKAFVAIGAAIATGSKAAIARATLTYGVATAAVVYSTKLLADDQKRLDDANAAITAWGAAHPNVCP